MRSDFSLKHDKKPSVYTYVIRSVAVALGYYITTWVSVIRL